MFEISTGEVAELLGKLLEAIKRFFEWLGILILPEDGDSDYYPGQEKSEDELEDIIAGA